MFWWFWSNFHSSKRLFASLFTLIFALIGTLLINNWKFLHLKSGNITDFLELLKPQQPQGRCAKTTGEDLAVLMKLICFPFVNFRDTFVAGRVDMMLKRECELEGGSVFNLGML